MLRKILVCFLLIYILLPSVMFAHPGNTDGSGGHTCRTNCPDWGLSYDEYHYHDGSGGIYNDADPQADYDAGYDEGYDIAYGYTSECEEDYEWEWSGTQDYGDGFEDGIDAGHSDGLEVCYEDSYAAGMQVGETDSHEGVEYDEDQQIEDIYDVDSFLKGYVEGYDESAYAAIVETEQVTVETEAVEAAAGGTESTATNEEHESDPYLPWKGFGVIMAFVIGAIGFSSYLDRKGRKTND